MARIAALAAPPPIDFVAALRALIVYGCALALIAA
jgi:hypothetical protein